MIARLFCTACFALCVASGANAPGPRITFEKVFKGSFPPYVGITVDQTGAAEYRETPDEEPLVFHLSPQETGLIFRLADKLDRFKTPLESGLKVAFMGTKTFRYEAGGERTETHFNYSLNEDARQLLEWFERAAVTERQYIALERTVKFDHLGVMAVVNEIVATWERNQLVAPKQFVPLLTRVAKNETYMHIARENASKLLDAIQAAGAPAPPATADPPKSSQ